MSKKQHNKRHQRPIKGSSLGLRATVFLEGVPLDTVHEGDAAALIKTRLKATSKQRKEA